MMRNRRIDVETVYRSYINLSANVSDEFGVKHGGNWDFWWKDQN